MYRGPFGGRKREMTLHFWIGSSGVERSGDFGSQGSEMPQGKGIRTGLSIDGSRLTKPQYPGLSPKSRPSFPSVPPDSVSSPELGVEGKPAPRLPLCVRPSPVTRAGRGHPQRDADRGRRGHQDSSLPVLFQRGRGGLEERVSGTLSPQV